MPSHPQSEAHRFTCFPDFLASNLRDGTKLRVYHTVSPPSSVAPIFAPLPDTPDEATTCESHFLAVSQPHVTDDRSEVEVLVLGIEVLVFTTSTLTTIFISKADSTGFLPRAKILSQGSSSIIREVIATFVEWLVCQQLQPVIPGPQYDTEQGLIVPRTEADLQNTPPAKSRKLVLSLFARSQNQYLFPGSVENSTKHVLDDRQLIKWWCRVLGTLARKQWPQFGRESSGAHEQKHSTSMEVQTQHKPSEAVSISPETYVIVPGCDRTEVMRSFFPPSVGNGQGDVKWYNSFPTHHLVGPTADSATIPVRCIIPRLPDDPKARYCQDLDDSGTDDKGNWRNIKSLQQFWETMEYRQECAAGRLVGFIWMVFDGVRSLDEPKSVENGSEGPVTVTESGYVDKTAVKHPAATVLQPVSLTTEQYLQLSDLLINDTDFAGIDIAAESTTRWIDKVKELSGVTDFGVDVHGRAPDTLITPQLSQAGNNPSHGSVVNTSNNGFANQQVNILTSIKKKRKAQDVIPAAVEGEKIPNAAKETNKPTANHSTPSVVALSPTVLPTSLVRKKTKH